VVRRTLKNCLVKRWMAIYNSTNFFDVTVTQLSKAIFLYISGLFLSTHFLSPEIFCRLPDTHTHTKAQQPKFKLTTNHEEMSPDVRNAGNYVELCTWIEVFLRSLHWRFNSLIRLPEMKTVVTNVRMHFYCCAEAKYEA
jgi:hypothetical protein